MPINYRHYSPDWKDKIRPAILKRDNYQCRICGVGNRMRIIRTSENEWLEVDPLIEAEAKRNNTPIIRIVLTVAHLNHIVTDNRDENLKSLCQMHHIRHDTEHKKAMRQCATIWNPDRVIKMVSEKGGEIYLPHLFVITRARRNQLTQLLTIKKKRSKYGEYSKYDKDLKSLIQETFGDYQKLVKATCKTLSEAYGHPEPLRFLEEYWSSDLKFIGIEDPMKLYMNPELIHSNQVLKAK